MSDLELLLRMLPWLAANPATTVDEVARRFEIGRGRVLDLLEMVRWSGFGEMYGEMVDIEIFEDGDVSVHDTLGLDRPLQLDSRQASAILAGLYYLAELPTVAPGDAVTVLIDKLVAVLPSVQPPAAVLVDDTARGHTDLLRLAIEQRQQVSITYVSAGAQNDPERIIEPFSLSTSDDRVYVEAWCHQAGDVRSFRIDRIRDASLTGTPSTVALDDVDVAGVRRGWVDVDMTVSMDHVSDFDPDTIVSRRDDGRDVHLRAKVANLEWLAGVMLSAGGDIVVHNQPRLYETAREMRRQWTEAHLA